MITHAQKWFILIWLALASFVGALALVVHPSEAAGYVFGVPIGTLACWGFAHYVAENV